MNLRWTLRRTSPAAAIMLMVGGLFLVSTSQAPRTQDASFDGVFVVAVRAVPGKAKSPAHRTQMTALRTTTPPEGS